MNESHLACVEPDSEGKFALEAALRREPNNTSLRAEYRAALERINRSTLGLSTIVLPELSYPLYFRGGSSDLANFDQIFGLRELSLPLARLPRRILDLGAYVGYASVFMRHHYPDADIVCVEPSSANFKLLTLNTAPYPRIRRRNGAVWSTSTTVSLGGHELGDWGAQFGARPDRDSGDNGDDRTVQAWSVADILQSAGWDRADLIKCDVEGAEREVFADTKARWHQDALCVTVETHDEWIPGCQAAVDACFDPSRYERVHSGEVWAYLRRDSLPEAPPAAMPLFAPSHARLPIELIDVSEGIWGFMLFDEHSCQLHPNASGDKPASLAVERQFAGQRQFRATATLPQKARNAVRFTAEIRDGAGGGIVGGGEWVARPGQQTPCEIELSPLLGRHRVILRTEMAEPGADSFHAWAHWIKPQFM